MAGQAHGLAGGILGNAGDLKENAARLHDGNPIFGESPFTGTRAGLGGLWVTGLSGKILIQT